MTGLVMMMMCIHRNTPCCARVYPCVTCTHDPSRIGRCVYCVVYRFHSRGTCPALMVRDCSRLRSSLRHGTARETDGLFTRAGIRRPRMGDLSRKFYPPRVFCPQTPSDHRNANTRQKLLPCKVAPFRWHIRLRGQERMHQIIDQKAPQGQGKGVAGSVPQTRRSKKSIWPTDFRQDPPLIAYLSNLLLGRGRDLSGTLPRTAW